MSDVSDNKLPLTRIQKLIGRLMTQSKQRSPCCYLQARADMTELAKMRKPYCREVGLRVTTNDFFFCAIARAAKKFPLTAAKFDETETHFEISEKIGIGFAVAAPQGLVVPVIKNTAEKSLVQIAEQSDDLLKKARANKLTPQDFQDANIVFTSLGMYGISSFFAIAPPGATGIISVGTIDNCFVPAGNDKNIRKIMSVALAVNRRIIDEFYAAKFLKDVIERIENPETLTN